MPTKPKPLRAASSRTRGTSMEDAAKALVLHGGGALGAYQGGVYEALLERDGKLDWVAGVSIGAVNAALIAGNAPEKRVAKLREFWELVSSGPGQSLPVGWGDRTVASQWSAASATIMGIPGLFRPRMDGMLLLGGAAPVLSYYDTSPLKSTLERLVDFDRINRREMRLSVGAVDVRTGNSVYFDNQTHKIRVEHIMASSALPPGFPPVHIDGADYWDGVTSRIRRTRMNTDVMAANVNLQQSMVDLLNRLPARMRNDPAVTTLCAQLEHQPVDIVHLIYRNKPYELDSKDYEFSRAMMQEHWDAGGRDMRATVSHPEWMKSATENGITTYDLAEPEAVRVRHPGVLAR